MALFNWMNRFRDDSLINKRIWHPINMYDVIVNDSFPKKPPKNGSSSSQKTWALSSGCRFCMHADPHMLSRDMFQSPAMENVFYIRASERCDARKKRIELLIILCQLRLMRPRAHQAVEVAIAHSTLVNETIKSFERFSAFSRAPTQPNLCWKPCFC